MCIFNEKIMPFVYTKLHGNLKVKLSKNIVNPSSIKSNYAFFFEMAWRGKLYEKSSPNYCYFVESWSWIVLHDDCKLCHIVAK